MSIGDFAPISQKYEYAWRDKTYHGGGQLKTFSRAEEAFIKSKDQCRIANVGKDGWPHCVPVGYIYKDGVFYIPSDKETKEISNLKINNRVCIVVDDENSGAGVMVQGYAEIVEDEGYVRLKEWMRESAGWSIGEYGKSVIVLVKPVRKASWEL